MVRYESTVGNKGIGHLDFNWRPSQLVADELEALPQELFASKLREFGEMLDECLSMALIASTDEAHLAQAKALIRDFIAKETLHA